MAEARGGSAAGGGFLLLDKPEGISSFRALHPAKRLFRGMKAGHAGTLDPAASGLLLVGIGHGTRLLEYLEGLPKEYAFAARFGLVSGTYDADGEVAGRPALSLPRAEVEAALAAFRGRIRQAPPPYSALKVGGRRAYDRARAGETVALEARVVEVYALELLAYADGVASLRLRCSKGTYVRSLAHDLGKALGCGAIADTIRRLAIGPFRVEDAVPFAALESAAVAPALLPLETAVAHLPAVVPAEARIAALLEGRSTAPGGFTWLPAAPAAPEAPASVSAPGRAAAFIPAGDLRVLDGRGCLLAIATLNPEGHLCPKKVLARS